MRLNNERCPWCGKTLFSSTSTFKRIKFGLSPAHLCPHCQNAFSSVISTVVYLPVIALIIYFFIGTTFISILLAIAALLCLAACAAILLVGRIKYYKISNDGKKYKQKAVRFTRRLRHQGSAPLHRGDILPTSRDFDELPAFQTMAPIKIMKYSARSGKVTFEFLYEHEDNEALSSASSFEAYVPQDENTETITLSQN